MYFSYMVNEISVYFVANFSTISGRKDGQPIMSTRSKAALELKRLRERAAYSVRQLAAALAKAGSPYGGSPSTFAYYESQYRRPYLPGDLVESLAPLLKGRGDPPITERQVLALGGPQFNSLWVASGIVGENRSDAPHAEIDDILLTRILERIAGLAAAHAIALTDGQRARLAARLYRRIARAPQTTRDAALEHEIEEILEIGRLFLDPAP